MGQEKSHYEIRCRYPRARFDQTLYYNVSGQYTFDASTQNAVQADDNYPSYLLGLADSYVQGSAQRENIRTTGLYLYAQDSWKINQSLTLNYGLRWELDTPLTDILHHVQTFRPGQNTDCVSVHVLTPEEQGQFRSEHLCRRRSESDRTRGSWVTKAFPPGLTQTYYKAFAPRIGISPGPRFSAPTERPAFAPDGGCSTTRWSNWCWSSSALSLRSAAARI